MSNTCFIRIKKTANYTVIRNEILTDKNLSWRAKGLLCYLLSLPDGWQLRQDVIASNSSEGKTAVSSGIKELIQAKYVQMKPARIDGGKVQGWEYIISECPELENGLDKDFSPSQRFTEDGDSRNRFLPKSVLTENGYIVPLVNTNNILSTKDKENTNNDADAEKEEADKKETEITSVSEPEGTSSLISLTKKSDNTKADSKSKDSKVRKERKSSAQKKETDPTVSEVIKYHYEMAQSLFDMGMITEKTGNSNYGQVGQRIKAMVKQGYTLDDFKAVIKRNAENEWCVGTINFNLGKMLSETYFKKVLSELGAQNKEQKEQEEREAEFYKEPMTTVKRLLVCPTCGEKLNSASYCWLCEKTYNN